MLFNQPPFECTPEQREAFQRARLSQDARFDGKFFTAVITTGIFCRPVCRVKPPKEENVRYLPNAVVAQQQGFRPCKRCLPELAPEPQIPMSELQLKNALITCLGDIKAAACSCQLSERQFRRNFTQHFGLSPNQFWQQHRLLNALRLLRNSDLAIGQVAFASGFNSVRRFNEAIKELYGKPPKQLLTNDKPTDNSSNEVKITLNYKGEFDWPLMLSFFRLRQISEIECVTEHDYARVFDLNNAQGYFKVTHHESEQALLLTVSCNNYQILPLLISKVRKMFDLDADMKQIHQTIKQHASIEKVIKHSPGLRLPGCFDLFEFTIRAILGQQVSVKAATTLAKRICLRYGKSASTNTLGMTHTFPSVEALTQASFEGLGLTQSRIDTLKLWVSYYRENHNVFNYYQDIDSLQNTLVQLKGIGPWTVNYIAMRGLSDPDAFPSADLGIIKALSPAGCAPKERIKNKAILALAEHWRPWRAYAAIYLWHSLALQEEQ